MDTSFWLELQPIDYPTEMWHLTRAAKEEASTTSTIQGGRCHEGRWWAHFSNCSFLESASSAQRAENFGHCKRQAVPPRAIFCKLCTITSQGRQTQRTLKVIKTTQKVIKHAAISFSESQLLIQQLLLVTVEVHRYWTDLKNLLTYMISWRSLVFQPW